jgi:ABC-2 type transport system permease protein
MTVRSSWRALRTLTARETILYSKDPSAPLLFVIAPTIFVVLLGRALERLYLHRGEPGIAVAVGFAVMFSFFAVSYIGWGFYRERMYGTWRRLESHAIPRAIVVVAKLLPVLVAVVVQVLLLTLIGGIMLDVPATTSWAGVVVVVIALGACQAGMALCLLSVTRTPQSFNQLSQLFILLGGAIGGALVPLSLLPGWAQPVGRALPQRWALDGLTEALSGDLSVRWLASVVGLAAAGVVLAVVGLRRLDWTKLRTA